MEEDERAERAAAGKREVRWSARRKEGVVMRLLRGESCECVQLRFSEFERHRSPKPAPAFRTSHRSPKPATPADAVKAPAQDGHRLWVGEATTSRTLGTGEAEMLRLREMAQFADAVDAHGVYLATSQPAFQSTTTARLRTALDELRVPPVVQELTSVALWPDLPARQWL